MSEVISALIDRPVAGGWRWAAGGLFMGLIWAVAVGGGVGNTRAAGRCGWTGGRLGLNLQPFVSQCLGEVVVDGHADGELLGAGFLVVHTEASLEMLLNHVIIVAFGNHWERKDDWQTLNTHLSESVKVSLCRQYNACETAREGLSGGWAHSQECETHLMSDFCGPQICTMDFLVRRHKWSQKDASENTRGDQGVKG